MEKLKIVIKKYWKIYLAALVISVICDLIGTLKLNIGIGTLTLFPMVFAVIFGGLLGPDIFKLFKSDECKIGGSLVLVVLAPFMAKMGISSGANLAKLVSVGPACFFRNSEILEQSSYLCRLHYFLALKKESIGACYSINRDSNLGLTTDIFGPDAPETKGSFAVYIVGFCNRNSIYQHSLQALRASWNIFDPIALGRLQE